MIVESITLRKGNGDNFVIALYDLKRLIGDQTCDVSNVSYSCYLLLYLFLLVLICQSKCTIIIIDFGKEEYHIHNHSFIL